MLFRSPSTTTIAFTSNQTQNVLSVSLGAGDWDVRGMVTWLLSSMPANTSLNAIANLSGTTGVLPDDGYESFAIEITGSSVVSFYMSCPLPTHRFNLSAAQSVYLVGTAPIFASGSAKAFGYIEARLQ